MTVFTIGGSHKTQLQVRDYQSTRNVRIDARGSDNKEVVVFLNRDDFLELLSNGLLTALDKAYFGHGDTEFRAALEAFEDGLRKERELAKQQAIIKERDDTAIKYFQSPYSDLKISHRELVDEYLSLKSALEDAKQ